MRALFVGVAAVSLLPGFFEYASAVDTSTIEAVRAKKVLDDADLRGIDAFVAQAVGELVSAEDFHSVSDIRAIIIANSASNQPGQAQFARQFSESAQAHIADALDKADEITPPERRFKVIANLLMLIDGLADFNLVELPLKYIDSDNTVIRYWAVKCLANPEIIKGLNSSEESDLARRIVRRLEQVVATSSPETLGLIAEFASSVKIPDGEDLLFEVADRRISSYADWSVRHELLDASILRMLADRMGPASPARAAAGRRFGKLLSYVFQRYIKGDDVLNPEQMQQLASVLVETERTCLPELIGKSSSDIKRAIEYSDTEALLQEHNKLLGSATAPGLLPAELNFDYGKDATGAVLTRPPVLANPPESMVSSSVEPPETRYSNEQS